MSKAGAASLPQSPVAIWIVAARPKTLWAAVAPVLIGVAMAYADGVFHPLSAALALLGAIWIQIGTNFYNDYADFKKGADTKDRKGPLRVTQAGLVSPEAIKRATIVAFGLAVVAGVYLMVRGGWPIIIIGVLSIISGILYTGGRYSLAYLGISDLFVLVFFGPVAVGGTYYVQALTITPSVLIAGLAPGLLAVAILLVNNIRDINEDRAANKKTLIVRTGRNVGIALYAGCVLIALVLPGVLVWMDGTLGWGLLPLVLLPLGVRNIQKLRRTTDPFALNPLLGATAQFLLLYSLLFSMGWNL